MGFIGLGKFHALQRPIGMVTTVRLEIEPCRDLPFFEAVAFSLANGLRRGVFPIYLSGLWERYAHSWPSSSNPDPDPQWGAWWTSVVFPFC